jgi:hypothetical protein
VIDKYAEASNETIIDVEKSYVEGLPMVTQLLGETTDFAKHPSDAMPQGTSIPLNTNRKLLTYIIRILQKCRYETLPVVSRYSDVGYSQLFDPFPQLIRRFQVPFPPHKGDNLPGSAVIGVSHSLFFLFPTYVQNSSISSAS